MTVGFYFEKCKWSIKPNQIKADGISHCLKIADVLENTEVIKLWPVACCSLNRHDRC